MKLPKDIKKMKLPKDIKNIIENYYNGMLHCDKIKVVNKELKSSTFLKKVDDNNYNNYFKNRYVFNNYKYNKNNKTYYCIDMQSEFCSYCGNYILTSMKLNDKLKCKCF